ncbi:MAG TPA: efflux RND transporter periplasmic adaptor subunit [Gemmatimonadales bacterium]|nr:efflux RND transporter periplasmic adaptor subunit [Gemmatimonadales bacterium]
MRLPSSRRLMLAVIVLIGVPGAWLLARGPRIAETSVVARVKRGAFKTVVTTSGELRALKFVQINVPQNAQQANQYQMKISSIVPEGTIVKAGDVVAELDRSGIASRASDVALALQKAQAVYEQAMLDSTLNLSKAREDMRTMDLTLEEKRLAKEQAVFEAPTVRRQAEIDLEKAQRALAQAKLDYKTRTEQAEAKMREVGADRDRQKNLLAVVQDVMANFTIKAPAPGMVTYVKEWNGKKKTTGSQVNAWEPAVATLPDLTQMESITYVNEIDVRKIAVGQPAVLTLDADPTKKLKGKVTSVANMGEQRPNQDAKVFEVKVVVEQADTTLRPGMTTGNAIETFSIDQALFVPLEAVNSENGVPFVYKQSGGGVEKHEVATGAMNDNEVVIARGLDENDRVLLSAPADKDKLTLVRLPGSATPPKAGGDTALGTRPMPPAPPPPAPPAVTRSSPPAGKPVKPGLAAKKG